MCVKFGAKRIYLSCRKPWFISKGWPKNVSFHACLKEIVPIESDDPLNFGERIHLVDGTVLKDIDLIIFATGYQTTFPFLEKSICPNPGCMFAAADLYKGIFLVGNPNIMFIGVQR